MKHYLIIFLMMVNPLIAGDFISLLPQLSANTVNDYALQFKRSLHDLCTNDVEQLYAIFDESPWKDYADKILLESVDETINKAIASDNVAILSTVKSLLVESQPEEADRVHAAIVTLLDQRNDLMAQEQRIEDERRQVVHAHFNNHGAPKNSPLIFFVSYWKQILFVLSATGALIAGAVLVHDRIKKNRQKKQSVRA